MITQQYLRGRQGSKGRNIGATLKRGWRERGVRVCRGRFVGRGVVVHYKARCEESSQEKNRQQQGDVPRNEAAILAAKGHGGEGILPVIIHWSEDFSTLADRWHYSAN